MLTEKGNLRSNKRENMPQNILPLQNSHSLSIQHNSKSFWNENNSQRKTLECLTVYSKTTRSQGLNSGNFYIP